MRLTLYATLLLCGCFQEVEIRTWAGDATPRGFNIACWQRGCLESDDAKRSIERAAALGARDVALVITWYVPDGQHGVPSSNPAKSPTFEELEQATRWAHDRGLKVLFKPHIDRLDGQSRTTIVPLDLSSWWQAYRAFILELATRGQALGVQSLVVGTELCDIAPNQGLWRTLIKDVRQRFNGALTYAANWDHAECISFWDALDWVGIDGYYPLAPRESDTIFDLVWGWEQHLARLRRLDAIREKPLIMTEVGAPCADPEAQKRVYGAALAALRGKAGLFFWNLWEGTDGGTHGATSTCFDTLSNAWSSP